jgi:hypothetical protein
LVARRDRTLNHRSRRCSPMDGLIETRRVNLRTAATEAALLFYEFCAQTMVGDKWLCVVVKYAEDDAFVVTAYLTDKPKAGEDLWPIK